MTTLEAAYAAEKAAASLSDAAIRLQNAANRLHVAAFESPKDVPVMLAAFKRALSLASHALTSVNDADLYLFTSK